MYLALNCNCGAVSWRDARLKEGGKVQKERKERRREGQNERKKKKKASQTNPAAPHHGRQETLGQGRQSAGGQGGEERKKEHGWNVFGPKELLGPDAHAANSGSGDDHPLVASRATTHQSATHSPGTTTTTTTIREGSKGTMTVLLPPWSVFTALSRQAAVTPSASPRPSSRALNPRQA
ncbi:hypothetical protein CPLU01_03793 [Colletotrichum plurivorum]|uniref:Uncharacterized protein n=1 Tax=Colletotrichum plurivorum TaxID=2175906 RepID=A0A8H6KS59_9PEZI|nr:hypothetical protein CPLU01_03793 [Colletotrichum plurivorum]